MSFHSKRLEFSTSDFTHSFFICIWDTITLIDLDFIHFYEFLNKANLTNKRSLITFVNNVFVICEEKYTSTISKFNDEWDKLLNDYDLIEVFNSINSSSKNSLALLFYKHILNLKDTKLYVEGNIRRLCFL